MAVACSRRGEKDTVILFLIIRKFCKSFYVTILILKKRK